MENSQTLCNACICATFVPGIQTNNREICSECTNHNRSKKADPHKYIIQQEEVFEQGLRTGQPTYVDQF